MVFIVIAVLIIAAIAFNQMFKIYELSRELRPNEAPVITEADNRTNAIVGLFFLVGFFAFIFWGYYKWEAYYLPEPASLHGVEIDNLWDLTMLIIFIPFVLCNVILFYFVWKYYKRKGSKATYFAHSNKLEAIWTAVPAVVLAALIIYGLRVWNDVTDKTAIDNKDALKIELYARQFDWTVRFAGADGVLGDANYQLINDVNALGLTTPESIDSSIVRLEKEIKMVEERMAKQLAIEESVNPRYFNDEPVYDHHGGAGHKEGDHKAGDHKDGEHKEGEHKGGEAHGVNHSPKPSPHAEAKGPKYVSAQVKAFQKDINRLKRIKGFVESMKKSGKYVKANDDLIMKGEFHIPVGKPVVFQFRSQDVIHSAFMPHFRAQMNCVPGMKTHFAFTPTITTAEMRKKTGNSKFDYYLLCNKICGNAHYNMKTVIVVDTPEDYAKWVKEQKTYGSSFIVAPAESPKDSTKTTVAIPEQKLVAAVKQ